MEEKDPKEREEWGVQHRPGAHWRDPVGGIFAGLVIIWLGVCFFLRHQGTIPEDTWWQYFLVGLGGAFLIGGFIRLLVARWRHRALGMLIPGIVVSAVGAMLIMDSFEYWPIILVAVGFVIIITVLARHLVKRKREEDKEL